ncbi:hypothetical protein FQA39_LY11316 [Lamprigera yunnana]|nr:hypothetical protein FQA39_LY11316 [Lamprigera yunnana]
MITNIVALFVYNHCSFELSKKHSNIQLSNTLYIYHKLSLNEEMSCTSKKLIKPQMHGFLEKQIRLNIIAALASGLMGGVIYYIFYIRRRAIILKTFKDEYDIEKTFEEIRKTGAFNSC